MNIIVCTFISDEPILIWVNNGGDSYDSLIARTLAINFISVFNNEIGLYDSISKGSFPFLGINIISVSFIDFGSLFSVRES